MKSTFKTLFETFVANKARKVCIINSLYNPRVQSRVTVLRNLQLRRIFNNKYLKDVGEVPRTPFYLSRPVYHRYWVGDGGVIRRLFYRWKIKSFSGVDKKLY
uniref:Uncharacterized protein n=1 Tax=Timema monikensis TaxID=170555 RepID=A0A7R9EDX6_9NEOP|nr:unnamed protein product [Timema monikensis]